LSEKAGQAFDRLGWHRWPMPVAILGERFDGRVACNNCSACQSGCPTGAMYDVSLHMIPKAIAAGATVIADARVEKIEAGRDGRVTGAAYIDRMTGVRHRRTADVVVLCGNGIGTPRLLLLSADANHPNGLANSSDQVGRNLMHHSAAIVDCWVDEPLDSHMGVINGAQISEEFAETDTARGFVNGFTLHSVRHNGAGFQALGAHSANRGPWGRRITKPSGVGSRRGCRYWWWATTCRTRKTVSRCLTHWSTAAVCHPPRWSTIWARTTSG
jgi:choline dehydrogenase-like flavoprotein